VTLPGAPQSRVFRPRMLIAGERGMGQTQLGQAVLHYLEGCQVCSFDLGSLMSETTRVSKSCERFARPAVMLIVTF
jgi:SpoVK/Ycf46/Vps4 family AAA+-type ATPase